MIKVDDLYAEPHARDVGFLSLLNNWHIKQFLCATVQTAKFGLAFVYKRAIPGISSLLLSQESELPYSFPHLYQAKGGKERTTWLNYLYHY